LKIIKGTGLLNERGVLEWLIKSNLLFIIGERIKGKPFKLSLSEKSRDLVLL